MRPKRAHCESTPRKANCASATPNQATGDETQKSGSLKNLGCREGAVPEGAMSAAAAAGAEVDACLAAAAVGCSSSLWLML